MPEPKSIQGRLAQSHAEDPALRDFVAPFPNLLGRDRKDLAAGFKRIAKRLSKSKRSAVLRFTLGEGKAARSWSVAMTPDTSRVSEGEVERPDLEVITSDEVWAEIASGKLSPLEAFGGGKVRVRGDVDLARLLARRLQRG